MNRRVLALAALALLSALPPPAASSHGGAITVASDDDLRAPHWTGAGTPSDPARLVATSVTASGGYAVSISNTRLHVNLSGLSISGGGVGSDGVRLVNVRNVTLWGSTIESNRWSVHVARSADVVVGANTIKTSSIGVYVDESTNVTLRDNRIALNDRDVAFRLSAGNTLRANNLSTATSQVGLHFEDAASYDNAIGTSNVVNGMPVRWYTHLAGATIADVAVDLAGITNVAQIMLYNATNVTLERPVAKSGIGSGILVHRSAGVTLAAPVGENNAQSGIHVELSNDTRIGNASARRNGASGVALQGGGAAAIEWSAVSGNLRGGIRITAATAGAALRNLTLASNAGTGVHVDGSRAITLENSSLAGDALFFGSSSELVVRQNTLAGAAATGISVSASTGRFDANVVRERGLAVALASSTRNNFTSNAIALPRGGTGFSFDGPGSYDNDIAPTNLVDGTPVRWYTNVAGPVRLDNVSVETRGITNVAQIGIVRSHNLTLAGATARNGTAAGILVWESQDANVSAATVASNAAEGVLADASARLKLLDARINASGGDGVRLRGSHDALVENTLAENGRARGIHVEASSTPTLRGNALRANGGAGISLDRAGPGAAAIEHNALERNEGGIAVGSSTIGTIRSNTLTSNGADGIALGSIAPGARVEDNVIGGHARGIRLGSASGTVLERNAITIGPAQWGVHFDDEASYNVSLPPTNFVNGVPLRWYVGAANATIANVAAEVRGITNVAQVLVYQASNVTLDNATAANGTARGIFVYRSSNVSVERSRAENNTEPGIAVSWSADVRVNGSSALRGQQAGVRLDAATRASVENATVRQNVGGIDLAGASLVDRVTNSTVADNGAQGVTLAGSAVRLVQGNNVTGHARAFHLDGVSGTIFRNNTVSLRPGDTAWHFASPAAYENDVDGSNRVDGVPMRWYARPADAVITGIRANLRGLTNVAQVALISPQNMTLIDAEAGAGAAHGFYVHGGSGTRILSSTASGNAADGVHVREASGTQLRNLSVASNDLGVALLGTSGTVIDNVTVGRSARDGISDSASIDLRIASSTIELGGGYGVNAAKTQQLNVSRVTTRDGSGGIRAAEASVVRIYDNAVTDARGPGILLDGVAAGAQVGGNRVSNATSGIRIARSEFAELRANAVTIGTGQTGIWFDDDASYNNVIPTTNTVNGAPVHWYTMLAGTEAEPVRLPGVRAEVRGMTNVAQVMLYRSSYVDVPQAVATNGSARGVYLYRSSAVTLDRANASGNALAGVELHATQSSHVRDLAAQASGVGVRLSDSLSNVVARVNASGAATGVHLHASSRDNRVEGVEVNGSARGVQDDGWTSGGFVGNNAIADAGSNKRVRLGVGASFSDLVATYRHDSSRITEQRWTWGDGSADTTSAETAPLKPTHTFVATGRYRVDLALALADGATLRDWAWVDVAPPLSAPRDLVALPGDRNATLRWSAPASDGASPITGYRIYRGDSLASVALLTTVASLDHVDASLANGQTYVYAVAAVNADGEGPRAAAAAIPVAPPGPPIALAAAPRSGAVTLTWEAPARTSGLPVTAYSILRATNGSSLVPLVRLGNVTTYTDTPLTNGMRYTYAVRAANALGDGPASANATATPVGPPGPPATLRALGADAAVVLQWSPPAQDGGMPITGYRVWRGVGNGALAELPAELAPNASTWRDTGLSKGERYVYALLAVNAVGPGPRSAPANATPQAIDALRPLVYAHAPAGGAILTAPPAALGAQYVDNDGVVLDSVRLYLDGAHVGANVSATAASYPPPSPLARGEHTLRLVLRDPTGNEADESWTFRILSEEDLVPRFELSGHALDPPRVRPGDNVSARVSVRNVGYAAGTAVLRVLIEGSSVAIGVVELQSDAAADVALTFPAPAPGMHNVTVGDVVLALEVTDELGLPVVEIPEENAADPRSATEAPGPRRPQRSIPPPREERSDVPVPLALLALTLAATALCRRRR